MRLENVTQEIEPSFLSTQSVVRTRAANDSLDEMITRVDNHYRRLRTKPSADREMRRFGLDENEYFAWRLTDYHGGERFDEPLCAAAGEVLGYSTEEVKDLAQEAYRRFTLHYGEEQ